MEAHKKDCEHGKRQREIELKAAEELERKKQQEGEDFFAEFVDGLEEFEGQYLSFLDNAPNWVCYPKENVHKYLTIVLSIRFSGS